MGSSLDNRITVTVLGSAAPVPERDFRSMLFGSNTVSFTGGDLWRKYEEEADYLADTDITGQSLAACVKFFSQTKRPPSLIIGAVTDDAGSGELAASLTAIKDEVDFYAVMLESKVNAQIVAAAAWVEANDGQGWFQSSDADFLAGTAGNVANLLKAAGYTRSHVIYHATDTDELAVGLAAQFFFTDPDVGATTAADQSSVGSVADDITATEKTNIFDENGNVFFFFFSAPVMYPGTMADGGWIDYILTSDWLQNRSQVALIQAIKDPVALGGKTAYTDKGIAYLQGKAEAVMLVGVAANQLQPGTWSTTVPKIADVPAATRKSRGLTFTGQAYTAGAIQEVNYTIYLLEG
jgi:hypothetical protein